MNKAMKDIIFQILFCFFLLHVIHMWDEEKFRQCVYFERNYKRKKTMCTTARRMVNITLIQFLLSIVAHLVYYLLFQSVENSWIVSLLPLGYVLPLLYIGFEGISADYRILKFNALPKRIKEKASKSSNGRVSRATYHDYQNDLKNIRFWHALLDPGYYEYIRVRRIVLSHQKKAGLFSRVFFPWSYLREHMSLSFICSLTSNKQATEKCGVINPKQKKASIDGRQE